MFLTKSMVIKEYKINDLLSVRLIGDSTVIYIADKPFEICKSIALTIPLSEVEKFDEIDSIDDITENLVLYDRSSNYQQYNISPETEFFAHSSNLKTWYENGYDTRILHSNLAFPLLNRLAEEGDVQAKRVFKQEIAIRLDSGAVNVIQFLINEGYVNHLKSEEINLLNWDALQKSLTLSVKSIFEILDDPFDEFMFDYKVDTIIAFITLLINNNKLQRYLRKEYKYLDLETKCEFIATSCFLKDSSEILSHLLTPVEEDSMFFDKFLEKIVYILENLNQFLEFRFNMGLIESPVVIQFILHLISAKINHEYAYEVKNEIADILKNANKEILEIEVRKFIASFNVSRFKGNIENECIMSARKYGFGNIENYSRETKYLEYNDLFSLILKHLPDQELLAILLDEDLKIVENLLSFEFNSDKSFGFIETIIPIPLIDFVLKWIPPQEAKVLALLSPNFHLLNGKVLCDSPYIAVDETGHVTDLCLVNCSLGNFPNEILKLTRLMKLVLTNNAIEFVPEEINGLYDLKQLYLGYNKIESLPDTFCDLINLKHLSIDDNPLKLLPECIGRLDSLSHLDICATLVKALPDSFLELRLEYLYIPNHLCRRSLKELYKVSTSIRDRKVPN